MSEKKGRRERILARKGPWAVAACVLLLSSLAPAVRGEEVDRKEWENNFSLLCAEGAGEKEKGEGSERGSGLFSSREGVTALNFRTRTPFTPYLGAGLGSASAVPEEPGPKEPSAEVDSDYRFAAGLGCAIDGSTRLSLGYRFHTERIPGLVEEAAEDERKGAEGIHHFSIGIEKRF